MTVNDIIFFFFNVKMYSVINKNSYRYFKITNKSYKASNLNNYKKHCGVTLKLIYYFSDFYQSIQISAGIGK